MSLIIEIVLVAFYALVFIFLMRRLKFFQIEGVSRNTLSYIFIAKILIGVLLTLLYTYYYPDRLKADVFKYFDDGKVMYNALFIKPADYVRMLFGIANDSPYFDSYYAQMNNWYREYESSIYNDSHTIIRFNAFVFLFSFGYYNVHTVFMAFVALTGQIALFKFFIKYLSQYPRLIIFSVSLTPSVMFWSSGVLKEGLLFLGMGFLMYFTVRLFERFNMLYLGWVVFATLLLSYLKFYVFASLLPLLAAHIWCLKTENKNILMKYGIAVFLFIVVGLNFHLLFPEFNLPELMVAKQNDFYHLAIDEKSGSQIALNKLEPSFLSMVKNAPAALFNVLFLPHIFEKQNMLSFISALENSIYFILILIAMLSFKWPKSNKSLLLMCIGFTLFTFVLIGLITPVTGAIVRYKAPALPFFLMTLFLVTDIEAVKRRWAYYHIKIKKYYGKKQ